MFLNSRPLIKKKEKELRSSLNKYEKLNEEYKAQNENLELEIKELKDAIIELTKEKNGINEEKEEKEEKL